MTTVSSPSPSAAASSACFSARSNLPITRPACATSSRADLMASMPSLTAASVTDRIGVFIETLASDLILRSCSTALPAQASVSGEAPVAAAA